MDEGRFPPGTLLAQRYRVVSLLGRGGMGEVYRANDLLLGQTVALKFLPVYWTSDEPTVTRFRNEVRIARQISHPNVCRVYDIGEAEGSAYLSMEYVDGEDLASLLRRIGRLPQDKALEIARQLCAGLAAAHDKGVLHRDLKPGNIMLDGQGQLRITDFGLAGVAGEVKDIRSGTPGYLAPEQQSGEGVTARSDIYALGVVLHEVFTGKRPSADFSHPDLATDVDRVIRRCLADDPTKRPASALAVSAALPGGDPLAAALAAGETPSPEMVAASGETEGLRPIVAWALLAGVIVAVTAAILLSAQTTLYRRSPLDTPLEVLAQRAQDILQSVGYSEPPVDTAVGYAHSGSFLRYIEEHDKTKSRWDNLGTGALSFWYRGSPQPLAADTPFFEYYLPMVGFVWADDPPLDVPGMTLVRLNPLGRLVKLVVVPPQIEKPAGAAPSPDWSRLFAAAGLDPSKWLPAQPAWTPPVYSDSRAAWTGSLAERPGIATRIEAAAYRGKPVYFQLVGPWTPPDRMQVYQATAGQTAFLVGVIVLFLSMLVGGAILARRNLRLGRGDRRGAARLAAVVFAAEAVLWLFGAHHVPNFYEFSLFLTFLGYGLVFSALFWVLYIALEPYVRRRWPTTLVSWSRLLAGGFRDPTVGRDVLAGCLYGALVVCYTRLWWFIPSWFGYPPPQLESGPDWQFLGGRALIAGISNGTVFSLFFAFLFLFFLFLFRAVLRREWVAGVAMVLFLPTLIFALTGSPFVLVMTMILNGATVFLITRLGLLAMVVSVALQTCFLQTFPLTTNASAWYAGLSLSGILLMAAIACYGFYTSLGGRPMFGSAALEE
jgi:hypothetical protein